MPGIYPGTSTNVIIGILNESQNRTNLAALFDELMSNTPAKCSGWFATIPTDLPSNFANPITIFGAN